MEKKKNLNIAAISISKPGFFITNTPEETRKLGGEFSKLLKGGDIVFLKGDLGSGKTIFSQGVISAFGNKGFARSSSFMLVNEYFAGDKKLFHIDLYRLSPATVWDIGIEEYLYSGNISLIEWPERLAGAQNECSWIIEIEAEENQRKIKIEKRK